MPPFDARHVVQVLDERVVGPLDDRLLNLLALVEGDLLRVLDQAGVGEAELAYKEGQKRGLRQGSGDEAGEMRDGRRTFELSCESSERSECRRDGLD